MNLLYIYSSLIIFALFPYQLEGKIKPLDLYLLFMVVTILKALIDKRSEIKKIERKYFYASSAVIIALLLTTGFSSNPSQSLLYTVRYTIYFGFSIAVFSLISSYLDLHKISKFAIHVANLTAIIGLLQFVYKPEYIPGLKAVEGYANIRIFSTFGNPNFYAEYLIMNIPLSIALVLLSKDKGKKFYFSLSSILLFVALLLTYTRGSFLGLLAGLSYMMAILSPQFIPHSIVLMLFTALLVPGFLRRLIDTFNLAEGSQSFRLKIWKAALSSISSIKEWMVGSGPYTFMDRFRETVLSKPELYFGYVKYSSHNVFLMSLVEGGIILLISWITYFSYLIYKGLEASRVIKSNDQKLLAVAFAASLVGVMVNGFTSSIFYHPKTMTVFFTFVGLLLSTLSSDMRQ